MLTFSRAMDVVTVRFNEHRDRDNASTRAPFAAGGVQVLHADDVLLRRFFPAEVGDATQSSSRLGDLRPGSG